MTIAARAWLLPSFDLRGAGPLLRYGGAMTVVQFFWFLQSQSDIFIGGRWLDPHMLGVYSTALFLTQLVATKFVPPLNEVAFAAYSRLQAGEGAAGAAFLRAVRLVMLVALPAYAGMAATAGPLVETMLGPKWIDVAALVPVLALAMPMLTLQILFAPATNARGFPGIAVQISVAGGLILPFAFAIGIGMGAIGLAWAWVAGMAVLLAVTVWHSAPAIGVGTDQVVAAVMPALVAAIAMGLCVAGVAALLPPMPAPAALVVLIAVGVAAYGGLMLGFARGAVGEAVTLLRGA
ncbi:MULTISPECIES: oligosaccharide flippase family protein [unclassified Sphingomonas]|uniref:oligosaccharide flippase family protein n=1 Tax=unclassified Sphingomonas TaxID=196159 RepID=UPI0027E39E53|nr:MULTISPECIES: oligosaccharide flippase family protein [unclassified Sphingomonas]